ncbi:MAG: ABC transporter permease [Treponema sp.]|jgi:peptide/nickel transport system permease protein|nr:ABC transporter permease [Treponema sp.]
MTKLMRIAEKLKARFGFSPAKTEQTGETRVDVAGQWQLMWWRFRKHKLALASGILVILIYLVAVFAEFLAPYSSGYYVAEYKNQPPQGLRFLRAGEDGRKIFGPYVYGYTVTTNPASLRREFVEDKNKAIPVKFFAPGEAYKMWGLFNAQGHLVCAADGKTPIYFFGGDSMGRDLFSRVIHGTRVSMSVGLIGVIISLFLGILLGGISGYYGGAMDNLIQRLTEFLRSIPTIPLWMGLAAAIPLTWPPLRVYFAITLILSLIQWTGLARVVRGKFFALKTEDFVTAARLDGSGEVRIILHHMVPSFVSHIIASVTLSIPGMILSETSLSFLGIGLRPPVVSWGVLLQEAQNIRSIAACPWLLFFPGLSVVIAVLSLNFLGDGLRDAADPYD